MADAEPVISATARSPRAETEAFSDARKVLDGTSIPADKALKLAKTLRNELAYGQAREIANRYRLRESDATSTLAFELLRVEVTSTYKDPEVSTDKGLADAWNTLVKAGYNPDTLRRGDDEDRRRAREVSGLAGAIKKRLWEYDGRIDHLYRSLHYYRQGYGDTPEIDNGYQAVNAAFVLDLIASLERKDAGPDEAANAVVAARRADANAIRERLVAKLSVIPTDKRSWWDAASLAEAFFGLQQYQKAVETIRAALAIEYPPAWEIQTTVAQLAKLARIQSQASSKPEPDATSPGWQALIDAFGSGLTSGVRSAFAGKIGLALSGGGFRASLYHIGVLARLAELDLLRHVEVLSCVSGGSILGAYFYLEVRDLLQTTGNAAITQQHYIDLVARVEKEFLAGVQTNIRMRLLSETSTAWENATKAAFSQTARLGELFEEVLYSRIKDRNNPHDSRWLDSLFVAPKDLPGLNRDPDRPFSPRAENWMLPAKAPVLILNATTVNTGHSWQFTASHMGEPPGGIDTRIDSNPRLRRVRYQDAPGGYRRFRLGHAVAASAAVPALFDPLPLQDLYAKPLLVRLSDGGVYDNQGIAGLLEQGCTFLIVSDASGQLELSGNPDGDRLSVAVAANDVLMSRVRGLQFDLLVARLSARTIRGAAFVHLRQDLEGGAVNQRGRKEAMVVSPQTDLTPYGVRRDMQEKLARLRTDLDAFSDFEAHALMMSGYKAMSFQLEQQTDLLKTLGSKEILGKFAFQHVDSYVCTTNLEDTSYNALCQLLHTGRAVFHKMHDLDPRRHRRHVWSVRVGAAVALVALIVSFRWTVVALGVVGAAAVAAGVVSLLVRAGRSPAAAPLPIARKSMAQRLVGLVSVFGSFAAARYLAGQNAEYLSFGALKGDHFLHNSQKRWPRKT